MVEKLTRQEELFQDHSGGENERPNPVVLFLPVIEAL
jgi:hypothetical protein